jgi:excisionase family DNA binding protein
MALIREEDRFYTAKEMAEALSVSLQTIERMKKDGRLRFIKIGKIVRFPVAQLKDMMEEK